MATYQVIVHETVELTYTIKAKSAKQAYRLWDSQTDSELGEPDEETLGTEFLMTLGPHGKQYDADGENVS